MTLAADALSTIIKNAAASTAPHASAARVPILPVDMRFPPIVALIAAQRPRAAAGGGVMPPDGADSTPREGRFAQFLRREAKSVRVEYGPSLRLARNGQPVSGAVT